MFNLESGGFSDGSDGSYNTSYELGVDLISGWGERYFYTYFSEFGNRPVASVIEVTILIITLISSILCNILIACAICQFREMRNITNYFLLNLVGADLVFAATIPPIAYTRLTQNWNLGDVACKIVPYSQFVCGFVLLWTLTLISMDRYRCIVVPPYRSQLTPIRTTLLICSTWTTAIIIFLPVVFWFREQHVFDDHVICTLVFPRSDYNISYSLCFTLTILFIACLIPMSLLVYFYYQIFRKIVSTRSRWQVPCVLVTTENGSTTPIRRDSDLSMLGSIIPINWSRKFSISSQTTITPNKQNGRQNSMSQHEELRLHKHLRVVRLLLLNVVVVLLMWLPITVISYLIYQDGIRPNENTNFFLRSHHFIWCLTIALLNTVVNPLLYGVFSENFRSCFTKWWFGRLNKKHNSSDIDKYYKGGSHEINDNLGSPKGHLPRTPSVNKCCINAFKGKSTLSTPVGTISSPRKNSSVGSIAEYPSEEN